MKKPPDIPKPPAEMTPNQALDYMARLYYEQTLAILDIADDIEELARDRDWWARVRREIDWAFWVVIGLPLAGTVLFLALVLATGASLFR
jgi:hypothetical protein